MLNPTTVPERKVSKTGTQDGDDEVVYLNAFNAYSFFKQLLKKTTFSGYMLLSKVVNHRANQPNNPEIGAWSRNRNHDSEMIINQPL